MIAKVSAWVLCLGLLAFCSASGRADPPASSSGQVEPKELSPIEDARLQASLAPEEPYWPFRLGELHLADGTTVEAERALLASLAIDTTYAPTLSLLSKLFFDAGRHREAVEMLEAARAASDDGGLPRPLLEGLALHYDALDEVALADALIAEIPQGDADGLGSSRVYLTLRGESPATAASLAREALKKDPTSAVNHNNYGITRLRAGDLAAARQAFLTAVEIDSSLPGPYYNLAILEKFYVFDEEAAVKWFRLYRKRSTADPDGLFEIFGVAESHASREGSE